MKKIERLRACAGNGTIIEVSFDPPIVRTEAVITAFSDILNVVDAQGNLGRICVEEADNG